MIRRGALRDPWAVADEWIGKQHGAIVENFDAAAMYADYCGKLMRSMQVFGGPNFGLETPVLCEWIHPQCFGTPDLWLFSAHDNRLVIADFKSGFGHVEVFENKQLTCYAAGILQLCDISPKNTELTVEFHIVQPRAFHPDGPVRIWQTTPAALQPRIEQLREAAASACTGGRTVPGAHCRHCEGRHVCTSAQRVALDAMDYVGTPLGVEMSPQAIANEISTLRAAQLAIRDRLTGLETHAHSVVVGGGQVPGFRRKEKIGSMEWKVSNKTIKAIGETTCVELIREKPLTPKQAIDAGADPTLVKGASKREKKGFELVEDDCSAARKVFGQ
jgi:hypothetical protein